VGGGEMRFCRRGRGDTFISGTVSSVSFTKATAPLAFRCCLDFNGGGGVGLCGCGGGCGGGGGGGSGVAVGGGVVVIVVIVVVGGSGGGVGGGLSGVDDESGKRRLRATLIRD